MTSLSPAIFKRWLHQCHLPKMASSMSAIYQRWLHQCLLSTKDRTSSMSAIYQRWLHQCLPSTKDGFINVCHLPKMASSMSAIYQRWLHQCLLSTKDGFINVCYLPKIGLHQCLLSTKDQTSSMSACYPPDRTSSTHDQCLSTKDDFITSILHVSTKDRTTSVHMSIKNDFLTFSIYQISFLYFIMPNKDDYNYLLYHFYHLFLSALIGFTRTQTALLMQCYHIICQNDLFIL